jgi:hypothetical protein
MLSEPLQIMAEPYVAFASGQNLNLQILTRSLACQHRRLRLGCTPLPGGQNFISLDFLSEPDVDLPAAGECCQSPYKSWQSPMLPLPLDKISTSKFLPGAWRVSIGVCA